MFDSLLVSEIYGPVVQGEGKSAGERVAFLRLVGCNLACDFCDSYYTWNWIGTKFKHPDKVDKKKEVHKMTVDQVQRQLDDLDIRRIVISGGEPMLQQSKLIPLLLPLKAIGYIIEVETNGTIKPLPEFLELVDQINCSPKTENSGLDNRANMRERPATLKLLSASPKVNFKFVVADKDDMPEILNLVQKYNMKEVYLMPKGRTKAEQLRNQNAVEMLAKENGFKFSPRLHVLEFDNKRGV